MKIDPNEIMLIKEMAQGTTFDDLEVCLDGAENPFERAILGMK